VLRGQTEELPAAVPHAYDGADWAWGAVSVVGALALAALLLIRARLPLRLGWGGLIQRPAAMLKAVHSGAIGDYAAWICAGAAAFSVVWGVLLR
jgi:hypothetical protein